MASYGSSGIAKPTSVTFRASGNVLMLYRESSEKYAGIVNSSVLCKVLRDFTTRFKATLIPEVQPETVSKGKKVESICRKFSIRIVVFGLEEESRDISIILADNDLIFHHPSLEECEAIKYDNPHYLRRPGSDMPSLESLSLSSDLGPQKEPAGLDERKKAQILQIFDSTDRVIAENKAAPTSSPRLRSTLLPYVSRSLTWRLSADQTQSPV